MHFYESRAGYYPSDQLGKVPQRSAFSLDDAGYRVHDLAMQRWLNRTFFVANGYPIPVIFSNPMDAFSDFEKLWSDSDNPFSYLFDLVDKNGKQVYLPHPSPPILPLLCVKRGNQSFDAQRGFSVHTYRNAGWATISDNPNTRDVAHVVTSRMPLAMNYRYQVDFFATRPDTQAYYVQRLMRDMFMSAASAQTFVMARYPGYYGYKILRLILDGDITENTEDNNEEVKVYRTTASFTLEGWSPDPDTIVLPALWSETLTHKGIAPGDLEKFFDLRDQQQNPEMPPSGDVKDLPNDKKFAKKIVLPRA